MGLDDTVNLDRIATALTKLAQAIDQYNILYRRQLDLEHPQEKPKRAPEVISTTDERREQFSDRATDQWMRETEAAMPPETASRFQKRFNETDAAHAKPAPRRRRAVEVSEVH